MTLLIAYSVLLKVFHFWHVIGKDVVDSVIPNFQYIIATIALLLACFLILRKIQSTTLRFWLAFSLNMALGLFFIASYMYYRMFAAPLDYSLLLMIQNTAEIGDSVFDLFRVYDLTLYLLDIVIIMCHLHSSTRNRLALTEKFVIEIPAKRLSITLLLLLASWYASFFPLTRWTQPFEHRGLYAIVSYGPAGHLIAETIREVTRVLFPLKIDTKTAEQILKQLQMLAEKKKVSDIPFIDKGTAQKTVQIFLSFKLKH